MLILICNVKLLLVHRELGKSLFKSLTFGSIDFHRLQKCVSITNKFEFVKYVFKIVLRSSGRVMSAGQRLVQIYIFRNVPNNLYFSNLLFSALYNSHFAIFHKK